MATWLWLYIKLPDRGVFSISLKYHESRHVDRFGNEFRYRAKINAVNNQSRRPESVRRAMTCF